MKTLSTLFIGILLTSCNISQYKGNNITRHHAPTLTQKIQGFWEANKVVYESGYVDKDPRRSFEFDLHGFFQVRYEYKDEFRIRTNLYEVDKNQIKLLNQETFEVYEIVEVEEITQDTFVIKSIYPENAKYTVHMIRS